MPPMPPMPPMNAPPLCRLLLVDDHTLLRQGLKALLDTAGGVRVVGEAASGRAGIEAWRALRPDVTLMDIRLPDLDGLAASAQILAEDPRAGIVMLSTYDGAEDIYRAMRIGARGYLLKDVSADELLHCLQRVHAGGTWLPEPIAAKLVARMRDEDLTPRECQILQRVAAGDSNKRIARHLDIGEGTVKTHLRAILAKLDATSRTEAIAVAQRRGLIRL